MTTPEPIGMQQQLLTLDHTKPRVCLKPATILLIDDDPGVRNFVQFVLMSSGYQVVVCASGKGALQQESEFTGAIDLILTDVTMPGIDGVDTANVFVQRRPGIKVALMSGYHTEENLRSTNVDAFIPKPFTPATLLSGIRQALNRSRDAYVA